MPSFGMRLNDLVPKNISENPERLADFEKAVNLQYGLKLDFDDSGAIGDVSEPTAYRNSLRWFAEKGENTFNSLLEATMDVMSLLSLFMTSLHREMLEEGSTSFNRSVRSFRIARISS